ncbi:alpha/beta fold hydrolase [Kordiimonas gwangyangensis]|uniref:alpha/beta fold hydrolase n=1 Tax=Kordiimonas gwangyangensis TaxID=288022 RepID=UPI0003713986|nr:alpha/beta hydrolase [Kordiimonas gwangyangensis]
MKKGIKYFGIALVLVTALLAYRAWTPDIPHDELAAKYATGSSDFLDLPSGARAHFRMRGNFEGRTLVLLHGSNASLHTWEAWADILDANYFVISVDLPGHGLTGATPSGDYTTGGMVDFVDEFVNKLNLEHFVLAGNSMGGGVTLAYALEHPEKLAGLVLVDAAGIEVPANTKVKVDRPLAFSLAGHWYSDWILENITPRSIVAEGLRKCFSNDAFVTEQMIDLYWELARHPGNREATGKRFAWYREGRWPIEIEKIKLPTLIMWGEDDQLIPVEVGDEMHKRIANSELVIYPGVGHLPHEENAAISATAVDNFVAGLTAVSD